MPNPAPTSSGTPLLVAAEDTADSANVDALILFSRPAGEHDEKKADNGGKPARRRGRRGAGDQLDAQVQGLPQTAVLVLPKSDGLAQEARRHLENALAGLRAMGKAEEVTRIAAVPGIAAPLVVVVGLGDGDDAQALSPDRLRLCAGAAVRHVTGRFEVGVLVPTEEPAAVAAIAEGAALGAYDFVHHRSQAPKPHTQPPHQIRLLGLPAGDRTVQAALAQATVLSRAVAWARDLVNTGPNELYPQSFADAVTTRAATLSGKHAVDVTVMDEQELRKGGFGGIIGVGQGSAHPPRIVVLRYRPRDATAHLAYVGKGITFDSGGLCIKPATSMPTMKNDMAGAAAVAAAVLAAAELGLPVSLTGVLTLAENMPSGTAQRPGDVVTMGNGTTVEIINTDAEGRMVLADGLCVAQREQPEALIDVATLTGAAIVALGHRTAAVLANDDALQGEVASAATSVGEPIWPMPIAVEIRAGMDSIVADLKHTGEPGAGGIMVGAAFLREFVGQDEEGTALPWAHLDIAGPAFNDKTAYGFTPKGGTGYGVRTLVALAQGRA